MNMNRTHSKLAALWVVPAVLLAAACSDSQGPTTLGTDTDLPIATSVVVDVESGGGADFLFLQPLSAGNPTAPLATGLDLMVTVCHATDGCVEIEAVEEDDHYHANWKSNKKKKGETYSVEVSGFGIVLGKLTLGLESKGSEKAGRTFPIKFWVGEGIGEVVEDIQDCVGDDRCNAEVAPAGETTVITTQDEDQNTMAVLTLPSAAPPPGGLVVTVDCRIGGFDPGEGPLPTALDQWPLFCDITALNPDGTEFTGVLGTPATLDVCVVDDLLQPPYHDFGLTVANLLLGKSTGPSNFEFLPLAASALTCDDITTVAVGPATGMLRSIGSKLASIFEPVLPQKLYAGMSLVRDGGVGGLISSFSDINPVEPASIAGRVTDGDGTALAGLTVTLSPGAMATVTDVNGDYSFGPLAAAVGGTLYTVTVSPLPPRVVNVTGSGVFHADFGIFFNAATGNYLQAFSNRLPWPTAMTTAAGLSFRGCVGHLATITSAAENAFIVTNMPQATQLAAGSGLGGGYWIGGFQPSGSAEPAGGWAWVTGEPFGGYTNWGGAEPNNSGGAEDSMQFLGDWSATEQTTWNDEPGVRLYGYVVEYDCTP